MNVALQSYKKFFFFIPFFLFIVFLPSCWPFGIKKAEKIHKDFVMVNVLDKKLYDDCHITGSINVTVSEIEDYASKKIDKNAEVVFYCSNYMCSASEFARKKLVELGFAKVFVYEGGMADWYQRGYPSTGEAKSPYLKRKIKGPKELGPHEIDADGLKKKIENFKAA